MWTVRGRVAERALSGRDAQPYARYLCHPAACGHRTFVNPVTVRTGLLEPGSRPRKSAARDTHLTARSGHPTTVFRQVLCGLVVLTLRKLKCTNS